MLLNNILYIKDTLIIIISVNDIFAIFDLMCEKYSN